MKKLKLKEQCFSKTVDFDWNKELPVQTHGQRSPMHGNTKTIEVLGAVSLEKKFISEID